MKSHSIIRMASLYFYKKMILRLFSPCLAAIFYLKIPNKRGHFVPPAQIILSAQEVLAKASGLALNTKPMLRM